MESIVTSYGDFAGLAKLRVAAQRDEVGAAREVGRQFEAFFIHSMLTSMRKASEPLKSGLWDTNALNSYEDMFDSELATTLAKTGGVGVTEWLVDQVVGTNFNHSPARQKALNEYQLGSAVELALSGAERG